MPSASELERADVEEQPETAAPTFREELETLINRHSMENGSNTPDWLLARTVLNFIRLFDASVLERERWYGRAPGEPFDYLNEMPEAPRAPANFTGEE